MKKMVVFTGSFNPVTKAHFMCLSEAVEFVSADKGLFVATNKDYLKKKMYLEKKSSFLLSEGLRKEMLLSLKKENDKLDFGMFELGKESPSTIKTLMKIGKSNPDYEIYYLAGADKLSGLLKWFSKTSNSFKIILIGRNDINVEEIIRESNAPLELKNRIILMPSNNNLENIMEICSTEVRNRFFKGEDYKDLLNDGPYKILSKFKPSDFPILKAEDIIRAHLEVGGRFGGNAARMVVFKDNLKLFKENEELFEKDKLISNTKVYSEEFKVNSDKNYILETSVVNKDCVDVAKELIDEGFNPAILNLASAVHPCGGYSSGKQAQEESLCYSSNLSISLYQFCSGKTKFVKSLGINVIPNVYPMNESFGGIYSKDVLFFRNNLDKFYTLKDKTFNCGVISVASLSYKRANFADYNDNYFDAEGLLNETGIEVEKNKIRTIFRIAIDNDHDSLVLGAFGCGVYRLNSPQVANLFKEVLNEEEFLGAFKKILFAIFEGKATSRKIVGENGKYKGFYDAFN